MAITVRKQLILMELQEDYMKDMDLGSTRANEKTLEKKHKLIGFGTSYSSIRIRRNQN